MIFTLSFLACVSTTTHLKESIAFCYAFLRSAPISTEISNWFLFRVRGYRNGYWRDRLNSTGWQEGEELRNSILASTENTQPRPRMREQVQWNPFSSHASPTILVVCQNRVDPVWNSSLSAVSHKLPWPIHAERRYLAGYKTPRRFSAIFILTACSPG